MIPASKVKSICCASLLLIVFLSACGKKSAAPQSANSTSVEDQYLALMNSGKNYLDKGSSTQAVNVYIKAAALVPTDPDVHLNLANAQLLAGDADAALKSARASIALDKNSAAAHFVAGCALNRLGRPQEAVKELQMSRELDPNVAATDFQLGLAHMQLKQYEEAIGAFQAATELEPDHLSAHYNLSQALARSGRDDESRQELEVHQTLLAKYKGAPPNVAMFEKSIHTKPRVPFRLEQPARNGIKVAFVDETEKWFHGTAKNYSAPLGLMDVNHRGMNDLFVLEGGKSWRVLLNTNGTFQSLGNGVAAMANNVFRKVLVADLQNDRFEDVLALGERGSQTFRFATNGAFVDATQFTGIGSLGVVDGALVDLDFTGKLDLLAVTATNDVRVFRNLGNLYFRDGTATSGIPKLTAARHVLFDDWNSDDIMDVAIANEGQPPTLLIKQRGGGLLTTNTSAWPAGSLIVSGDLNNDLRIDTVIAAAGKIEIRLNSVDQKHSLDSGPVDVLKLIDYDNDGWLDIIAATSTGLRAWRNIGQEGFVETTAELGFKNLQVGKVAEIHAADFHGVCATDLLLATDSGLKLLRNQGGNANHQVKVLPLGNRSNASGIGVKVELQSGGLRTTRTVHELPIELGAGRYTNVESLTVHWVDLATPVIDLQVECTNVPIVEFTLQPGSCPYLYAWDGTKHRFVTDILGGSPIGLPLAEGRYIEADPTEFVWIGNNSNFKPLNGAYQIQITEELREVLYLDEAKLVVIDHPAGTEVHSTDKLVPGKPFPPSGLITLQNRKPLLAARTLENVDVTKALQEIDRVMVSPAKLHVPQRRGMAEPHGVELDFGPLESDKPLSLALTGWLRFGGGMANIAISQFPDLPFPFPVLEVERGGKWEKVNVTAGAPIGKTKTIVIDLAGKLPPGSHKLRLSASFEIHWDRIALFEKAGEANTRAITVAADSANLHWRGFSDYENTPWTQPLTPNYDRVSQNAHWNIEVSGWCTRYGKVDDLIAKPDEALVLMNGGDELTLRFDEKHLPPPASGMIRDFFLYTDGWDKDADFHVARGTTVEPLPFHGMDDQLYGQQQRPPFNDAWIPKYNTRWIGPDTLRRPPPRVAQKR